MAAPFITSSGSIDPESQFGFFSLGPIPPPLEMLVFVGASNQSGFHIENAGTSLGTLMFPRLVAIDPDALGGAVFTINGNSALQVLAAPILALSNVGLTVENNGSLWSVDLREWTPIDGQDVLFGTNHLDQMSVDLILARCVANGSYASGHVNLAGGSNSHPSVAGMVSAGSLVARGVNVWIHP